MFADTDAIRAFGASHSSQSADLAAVAAALTAMPDATVGAMLGPVGARFVAALAEATTDAARAVAALSDRLDAGYVSARASAAAYENADERTGALVSRVY